MKSCLICILLVSVPFLSNSQNTAQDVTKDQSTYTFGQIYSGFYYCTKDTYRPRTAFVFNQGILGFNHDFAGKVNGKIMFDVTRTTNFFWITDSAGNEMKYDYFEGSKYTAYLKMAEVSWNINKVFTLRVGQLLTTEYLTFQDKFWGYRYIDVTYMEKFRLGNPADFGVQLDYSLKDKLLNQFSVVNGEGPFRYQDSYGNFIFSDNIQFYPTKNLTFKFYADYGPSPDTGMDAAKTSLAGFAGYKNDKFRIGGEYAYIFNYGFISQNDFYGLSVYGSVVINKYFQALVRYDHLTIGNPGYLSDINYYIAGFQYEPAKPFTTSINFRYYSVDALPFVYANFGLKF
ncbi:MAG: hypothetical protein FJY07_08460 [Bacteroidetes bacterium]|nr:hypothetical protein [Bacteroidota bacterium]